MLPLFQGVVETFLVATLGFLDTHYRDYCVISKDAFDYPEHYINVRFSDGRREINGNTTFTVAKEYGQLSLEITTFEDYYTKEVYKPNNARISESFHIRFARGLLSDSPIEEDLGQTHNGNNPYQQNPFSWMKLPPRMSFCRISFSATAHPKHMVHILQETEDNGVEYRFSYAGRHREYQLHSSRERQQRLIEGQIKRREYEKKWQSVRQHKLKTDYTLYSSDFDKLGNSMTTMFHTEFHNAKTYRYLYGVTISSINMNYHLTDYSYGDIPTAELQDASQ